MTSEYPSSGVDYRLIQPFKEIMISVGKRTTMFPSKWDVVVSAGSHTASYRYTGVYEHSWVQIIEGLGNKNWIAEWMYKNTKGIETFHEGIGWDVALSVVNDVIVEGAMPVVFTDMVAASDSEWFADKERAFAFSEGILRACEDSGMALVGGETQSSRYLVKPGDPVKNASILSGSVVGIIAPSERRIESTKVHSGDRILGVTSNGPHCNGFSLMIKRALGLQDSFLTIVPETGRTLGEEILAPTRSYVSLVEALLEAEVEIHAIVPGTGDGVAKLAYDKRPFTYRIGDWPEVQPVFRFFLELGVSIEDCLKTFNWGVGYYVIVPRHAVARAIEVGTKSGYDIMELGRVEEGSRQVIFEPEGITLRPQGE